VNGKHNRNRFQPASLCLDCALCCNGVLFADVRLQAGDRAAADALLALLSRVERNRPSSTSTRTRVEAPQPCAALKGCRCVIYEDRPSYCREFKCALLMEVESGNVAFQQAAKTISATRLAAEKVKRLLRMLGNTEEHLPISHRFRRTTKHLEEVGLDSEASQIYGRLTLAFHDLNFQLSSAFYPG
jgi:Fe-S-cluster containining protein